MTIAAGFVYDTGVLMCADTLVTGGYLSDYQSKLVGIPFTDGAVLFAFAGHVDMADAAIQQCEYSLTRSSKKRSGAEIAQSIRNVLAREYKTHVVDNHYEGSVSDYSILAAIYSALDGEVSLYCSYRTQLKRSRERFACIGAGEVVGKLAVQRFPHWAFLANKRDAAITAARVLSNAKKNVAGFVGGESVMIALDSDGTADALSGQMCSEKLISKYSEILSRTTDSLQNSFFDSDESFEKSLTPFCNGHTAKLREAYREELASVPAWHVPPMEATLIMQLNKNKSRKSKEVDSGDLQPPKGGPLRQRPSQELPGGSGES